MALVPDLTMWIFDHNVCTQTSPQALSVVSVAYWLLSMVSAWSAPPTPGTSDLSASHTCLSSCLLIFRGKLPLLGLFFVPPHLDLPSIRHVEVPLWARPHPTSWDHFSFLGFFQNQILSQDGAQLVSRGLVDNTTSVSLVSARW